MPVTSSRATGALQRVFGRDSGGESQAELEVEVVGVGVGLGPGVIEDAEGVGDTR